MWALLAAALLLPPPPAPGQAVVLRVSAPWCAPCLEMAPDFERVARAFAATARFRVLDADTDAAAISRLGIRSVPVTLIRFHGRIVERDVGYLTAGEQWALGVRASIWPSLSGALGAPSPRPRASPAMPRVTPRARSSPACGGGPRWGATPR